MVDPISGSGSPRRIPGAQIPEFPPVLPKNASVEPTGGKVVNRNVERMGSRRTPEVLRSVVRTIGQSGLVYGLSDLSEDELNRFLAVMFRTF